MRYLIPILFAGGLLSACSSTIPQLIKEAPPGNIQVEEAQQSPDAFRNAKVRWGGTILGVENLPETTQVEVLARRLSSNGKPIADSHPQGRFKVALPGFVEPEEFPKERLITVAGTLLEVAQGRVGEYPYPYPIVAPDSYYIWPAERDYDYAYPYYYDPFYYPWYYPYWWHGHRYPYYW